MAYACPVCGKTLVCQRDRTKTIETPSYKSFIVRIKRVYKCPNGCRLDGKEGGR